MIKVNETSRLFKSPKISNYTDILSNIIRLLGQLSLLDDDKCVAYLVGEKSLKDITGGDIYVIEKNDKPEILPLPLHGSVYWDKISDNYYSVSVIIHDGGGDRYYLPTDARYFNELSDVFKKLES